MTFYSLKYPIENSKVDLQDNLLIIQPLLKMYLIIYQNYHLHISDEEIKYYFDTFV